MDSLHNYFTLGHVKFATIRFKTCCCYGRPMEQVRPLHFCPVVSSSSIFFFFLA